MSEEIIKNVELGLERRGFSAFFGRVNDLADKLKVLLGMPDHPPIVELDKTMEKDKLHFSILMRPDDTNNPVPAYMVSKDVGEGRKLEIFVNSSLSFNKAANLMYGRAVQLKSDTLGYYDPIWLRAEINAQHYGLAQIKQMDAFIDGGNRQLKEYFKQIPLRKEPSIFQKELWRMELARGEMVKLDAGEFGKFYVSAEPEINSLSLWDKDKKLLMRDITNEQERQRIFNPESLHVELDQKPKIKKGNKL